MTKRTGADALAGGGDGGTVVSVGDGWESDDGGGGARRPEDGAGKGVVAAFGQTLKTLRLREGLDRADEVLGADGLLCVWKEEVERAQYPVFFQGMATLEKEAVELLAYDTLVVKGLLQTEEYMRAVLAMRRPPLDQETTEQRVTARLARQDIFDRTPSPLLSFIMDESVLRRPYGGTDVLRGQLEYLLLAGQRRNVEIQLMPVGAEDNAGVNGPFTVVTRKDGKRFVYAEAQGIGSLQTDPEQATLAHARYGIIRSQALSPRESLEIIEGVLGSL